MRQHETLFLIYINSGSVSLYGKFFNVITITNKARFSEKLFQPANRLNHMQATSFIRNKHEKKPVLV
ncbi:hypothetical protein DT73_18400 [Mangrovibacter sp. MFB070]|nr:hypothetical protein DT73_18400 [Mangrovibacter sp. MFB070]